jgi:hypothetical protein
MPFNPAARFFAGKAISDPQQSQNWTLAQFGTLQILIVRKIH